MKGKIKNPNRKAVVEAYQQQIRVAIDNILSRDGKLKPSTKEYVKVLEENIKLAPYVLGYLEWPKEKKNSNSSQTSK